MDRGPRIVGNLASSWSNPGQTVLDPQNGLIGPQAADRGPRIGLGPHCFDRVFSMDRGPRVPNFARVEGFLSTRVKVQVLRKQSHKKRYGFNFKKNMLYLPRI